MCPQIVRNPSIGIGGGGDAAGGQGRGLISKSIYITINNYYINFNLIIIVLSLMLQ